MYILIEYSSKYSETTRSLWFHSNYETANFDADIGSNDNFKSFKYETKLLRNMVADGINGTVKNATMALPLKYLTNFWRSFEMLLINCKVELKRKWTKYCVLSEAGAHNANANSKNIIFTIKDTKLYVSVVTVSGRENEKLRKRIYG